jgi:hypothetical protein
MKFWTRWARPTIRITQMTDLTHATFVEVVYDAHSKKLWVNTENGNVCRIYNIGDFHFRQAPERRHETVDDPLGLGPFIAPL